MTRTSPITLGFSQGYAQVEALHERLVEVLGAAPAEVVIDAGGVEQIDVSTLQVLAAFARDLEHAGGELRWTAVSPRLRTVAGLTGLTGRLALPEEGA